MNTVSQTKAQNALDCSSMLHLERTVTHRPAKICSAMSSELLG